MTINIVVRSALCVKGLIFEQVGFFKYLRVNNNKKNNMHCEIKMRLNAVNGSYFTMKEILSSKLLPTCTKERLYYTCMHPILTYVCETWSNT